MLFGLRRHLSLPLRFLFGRSLASGLLLLAVGLGRAQAAPIAFVQTNSATPQTPQATVTVTFNSAQTLGDLNVVIVGWNDSTATVSSVADTKGNTYALAAAPIVQSGTASQAIYYAKNITSAAAGANTVTVTFNVAARFPDIRIAEYSGVDTVNPLDVSAGAQGSTATSSSGSVTTTNANDLLIGANLVQSTSTAAGVGYTNRGITPDGDILEDRVVTATASYSATAALDKVQQWIMQMAAFRAAGSGTSAPSIASLNPTSGPVGTSVTITGANFGSTQGSSSVTFNSTTATPASWTANSIVVPVPAGAATGNVVVTVNAVPSNGVIFTVGAVSAVSFTQSNSATPQGSFTTVAVPFTLAQAAGNLNVVVVGWNDSTATISAVTDSLGNIYAVATAPVVQAGTASQAIYYAKNIAAAAAGANTVTVTFAAAALHPDIRIAEYSGLDPLNPLDTSAGAQGTTTSTSDSGLLVTGNPNDLLVGANIVQSATTAAGPGYTSRGITADGDILEDQVVSTAGSYNATAVLDKIQSWIMQMVAFRAAGSGGGTVPNIASLNPTSGAAGVSVTIQGSNFGATQGTSTVKFNGTPAAPTSWGATSITVPVPAGATSGGVIVTVGGVASNSVNFSVTTPAPSITNLNPTSGLVGASVTITGANFGASQGASTVTFNGTAATPTSWTVSSIAVPVPAGATTGNVVVTVGGMASNGIHFSVLPNVTSLTPNSGPLGTSINVAGSSFGAAQGSSTVTFNGIAGTPASWSDTSIAVPVPNGATTGNVVVMVGGIASNGVIFTVTSPGPNISTLNPTSGTVGASVTISGANFGSSQGTSSITFNGTSASPTTWTATSIVVPVPATATTGPVIATVSGVASNPATFTVVLTPSITNLNPTSGQVGASVTITGTNFGASQGTSTVAFNGISVTPTNWTATSITAPVPTTTSGNVVVTVSGVPSNGINFTVLPPSITSLSPTSGTVGTPVTIAGSGFGSFQGSSSVSFNGTNTVPTSWGATTITVPVPTGATTGNVVVSVAGMASNGLSFTVTAPPPSITSLSPSAGAISASVTIAGTNFGASQGTSTVTFNGVSTTPTSWGASSIIAPVPVGATTGNVVVTVGGAASNGILFTVQSGIATIQLIQHASKDAGSTSSAALAFPANNTAGNFIAVAIRAGRSGAIFTVSDTLGNTYRQAIQYNITVDTPNGDTLGIFYAENIVGGANTVTVADNINGKTLRFAILEYSGIATSGSLDVTAVNQGTSTAAGTVSVNTTANGDLLFGAVMDAAGDTVTAGTNYILRDVVPAAPNTKLITEDAVQAVAGAATASATLSGADKWGAGLAAFKPAAGGGGAGPSITGLNPTSGVVGTSVTISGTNFGGTQGSSSVTFNGAVAAPTNWSVTSITVPVPANAISGNVVVTVGGVASNGVPFTVTVLPPSISTLNPTSGAVGVSVTIAGSNFGATQGASTVTFNGIATTPTSWSASSIAAPVPNGATTGNVVVTVAGVASNGVTFTVSAPGPSLSTLSMTQGPVGAILTITGVNFGSSQGTSTVTFGSTSAGTATNWSSTSIDVPVPAIALGTVNVVVTVAGVPSNGLPFTVTPPPSITNIIPTSGPVGTVVTINGANFGPTVGTRTSLVLFNGLGARTNNWSNTQILVPVPAGATTGNVVVSISGIVSNGINFTVTLPPSITSLSPTSGLVGTSVTISGTNFGATQGTSTVTFNGTPATPTSWSDPSIVVPVPNGATTGNVVVTVGGVASNGASFTVTSSGAPIALVQHIGKDAGLSNSSSLAFNSNNAAGNWIGVCVRAGKPGQVFTVTDSRGNTYHQAIQFNEFADGETVGIFYAENIAGGANTVTLSDTISGQTLRFAILEYSGILSANSLDATAVTSGSSTSPNSGNATTLTSGDLLLGAIATADTPAFTAGSGYKIEETVPAPPSTKLMVEDMVQTSAGTASASASISTSEIWIAALAAFRAASGGPPPPISVSVSPTTASTQTGSGTQVFTATVQFDSLQQGVTFSLSGGGCSGATCGTLSNVTSISATYTAPANLPSPATVTLRATSVTDNTKSATATITVVLGPLTVTVSPKRGSITTSQTQQFIGTAFNDPNNAGVTWQVDGNNGGNSTTGTITPSGLFAPGTQAGLHTITATSVTNASVNTSVNFAVSDIQGVFKYHNDLASTGQNLKEYALTPATVNSSTFSRLFSCPVDGYIYAQPLYVPNLTVGSVTRNVVFIATEHDSVYAFDADSSSCLQLWMTSFLGNMVTTMPWTDTSPTLPTNDVFPEIGITSTPVIDPATGTIYVEAKTKETTGSGCSNGSPCYVHRLHALNITTGAEKFGGPVVISAPNFSSFRHFNRPALLLANSTIYIGFGSHGDICNWQGWLFGYDAATLVQKFAFSTANPTVCNGASIWDGGAGPAVDAGGNVYVTTGNGAYDPL